MLKSSFNFTLKKGLFFLSLGFFVLGSFFVQSKSEVVLAQFGESILDYQTEITMSADRSLDVTETIVYDNPTPHHGLFRVIPYKYKNKQGINVNASIRVTGISYFEGDEITQTSARPLHYYSTSKSSGSLEVKIGDADTYIKGSHVYILQYTVSDAILFFDDHDELYWNIVGDSWDLPIEKANVVVRSPAKVQDTICYTGTTGLTEQDCEISLSEEGLVMGQALSELNPGENFTIAVAVEKGVIKEMTPLEKFWKIFVENVGFLLIIPSWLVIHVLWMKFGKDPKVGTVIPEYGPVKGLNPLLAGYMISNRTKPKFITAEIIHLAINGYLKIIKTSKKDGDFKFLRTDKEDSSLLGYEKSLLNGLFARGKEVTMKSIKPDFYKTAAIVKNSVKKDTINSGYFNKFSGTMSGVMIGCGTAFVFFMMFIGGAFIFVLSVSLGIWLVTTALMVVIYGFFMGKRTPAGNKILTDVMGLKMYMEVAEKDRINFHNDPAKYTKIFETLLPYAMVFGMESKWATLFKDIYKEPPDWYSSNDMMIFNSVLFANSLNNSLGGSIASASAPPSSGSGFGGGSSGFGGGGFSGGGGGGGGGGGW